MRRIVLPLLAVLAGPPAAAQVAFDHSAWDDLLRQHVADGLVDYDAFRDAPSFQAYLRSLDRARPEALPEPERLAFWINVYNAFTIELVNRHGERESIRNINRTLGLALKGPWREEIVRAGGGRYHLDHVEHEIVRQQFAEPRIHFALVCAARSCPTLRGEAYTGARLDEQLEDQARRFLRERPGLNHVDPATRSVRLSPIVGDWYRRDFGPDDAALGRFLARYWPAGPERELLLSGRFRVTTSDYDWTLNSRAKGPLPR